ncbi:MAG: PQQ-dependent sugar dehydrogenase [Pseudomonadota bacterium]
MNTTLKAVSVCLASFILASCGGSSGSGSEPTAPPALAPEPAPPLMPMRLGTSPAFPALTFNQPLSMVQIPGDDSHWYLIERAGRIWRFPNDSAATSAELFLDLSEQIESGPTEAGLLGLAMHPEFALNGEVYVSYTRNESGLESVVARLRSSDDGLSADLSTEEILLTLRQDFNNHNGGQIVFGPDGRLYVGFGDGGSGDDPNDRAQDASNLMGALLRIDVNTEQSYAIPNDNPFSSNARCEDGFGNAPCPEIFAYGLRNPWRFTFDREDGALWLGDVGQDRFEEVNRIELGANYGWRVREGANCNIPREGCNTNGLSDPVTEYEHSLGASITGGYVYRGSEVSLLEGRYLFGDFVSGRLFAVAADAASGAEAEELLETDFRIASFAEDGNGDLYLLDFAGGGVHQLIEVPDE